MFGQCRRIFQQIISLDKRYFSVYWRFHKKCNEETDEGYLFEVDVQFFQKLHEFRNDLPVSNERIKTKKIEKLVANLYDKTEYVIHIRNLKQILNNGTVLKKVHRVIKFNKSAWLKPYIYMNTDPRKKTKEILEKTVWSWWIMHFLEKLEKK